MESARAPRTRNTPDVSNPSYKLIKLCNSRQYVCLSVLYESVQLKNGKPWNVPLVACNWRGYFRSKGPASNDRLRLAGSWVSVCRGRFLGGTIYNCANLEFCIPSWTVYSRAEPCFLHTLQLALYYTGRVAFGPVLGSIGLLIKLCNSRQIRRFFGI